MAVRPIDANAMLNELRPVSFEAEHSAVLLSDVSKMVREWVECQPTLTPPNDWISVNDKLPEDEAPVLAYYGFFRENDDLGARFIGTLTFFVFDKNPHWQHESTGLFVTHWMPLPEPPSSRK